MAKSEIEPRALLLDIEGTTTPISFVTDVLFPYARQRGREFILTHLDDPEIQAALRQLQVDGMSDVAIGVPAVAGNFPEVLDQIVEYYFWLMDRDRKSTPLKTIQGRIWEEGYTLEQLQSDIFPDVLPALERWHGRRRMVAIYSSGSVLAQRLLFRYTRQGDLSSFISSYFDTRVGTKRESESYVRIAGDLKLRPREILFVSDVTAELEAARMAGMNATLCVRPGNPRQPSNAYPLIRSFDELP